MKTKVTQGISVSVEVFYIPHQSNTFLSEFIFGYKIVLENKSNETVKLLRRHWCIIDSNGDERVVEGEGVVGQQPVLEPLENYSYSSGCNLKTDMGKMYGTFTMQNLNTNHLFDVQIPAFEMIVPHKMN